MNSLTNQYTFCISLPSLTTRKWPDCLQNYTVTAKSQENHYLKLKIKLGKYNTQQNAIKVCTHTHTCVPWHLNLLLFACRQPVQQGMQPRRLQQVYSITCSCTTSLKANIKYVVSLFRSFQYSHKYCRRSPYTKHKSFSLAALWKQWIQYCYKILSYTKTYID